MRMELLDAHSHVHFAAYKNDADEVIRRALAQGIGLLAVGTRRETSADAVEVALKYDGVWAVVGLHPNHLFASHHDQDEISDAAGAEKFDAEYYRGLVKGTKKVVALGECGLDYYRMPDGIGPEDVKRVQKENFRSQLDLALELGLPVMIHCRDGSIPLTTDAHDDVASILEEYAEAGRPLAGDIHCFTGTIAEAERYLALGFFISFTGVITYPPNAAQKASGETAADVVRAVPLDRLLVETDSPYLAPVPHRGKRNEPAYVRIIAEEVARIKGGLSPDEVASQTLKNTRVLFGI